MESTIKQPLYPKQANSNESAVSEAEDDLYVPNEDSMREGGDGNFFSIGTRINWTHADHSRLQSIDELHTRLLEYHNNVHARGINGLEGIVGGRLVISLKEAVPLRGWDMRDWTECFITKP